MSYEFPCNRKTPSELSRSQVYFLDFKGSIDLYPVDVLFSQDGELKFCYFAGLKRKFVLAFSDI